MILYCPRDKTITPATSCGSQIPLHFRICSFSVLPSHAATFLMAPPHPESTLVYDNRMDEDQYACVYSLYPELQSYSHDAALGSG